MREKRKYKVINVSDNAASRTLYRSKKIGRNELCPCGSGKKAKNCCGTEAKYSFLENRRVIIPENKLLTDEKIASKMKETGRNFIETQFNMMVGQEVMLNDRYPDESFRERPTRITDRGLDSDAYNPYYKVALEGIDSGRWIAEYCISPIVQ